MITRSSQGQILTNAPSPSAMTDEQSLGSVRITKHVLAHIIELAALSVPGVERLAPVWSPWPRLWQLKEPQQGLAVLVRDGHVSIDLYLILDPGSNLTQVGRAVQDAVVQALDQQVGGMVVDEVNVFIQDIA